MVDGQDLEGSGVGLDGQSRRTPRPTAHLHRQTCEARRPRPGIALVKLPRLPAVLLWAYVPTAAYTPGSFAIPISVGGRVNPRATLRLEGLRQSDTASVDRPAG